MTCTHRNNMKRRTFFEMLFGMFGLGFITKYIKTNQSTIQFIDVNRIPQFTGDNKTRCYFPLAKENVTILSARNMRIPMRIMTKEEIKVLYPEK
jgi:hypothetical protein